jgi:uncharacterized protein YprB with RNaseH-like and TPR domain
LYGESSNVLEEEIRQRIPNLRLMLLEKAPKSGLGHPAAKPLAISDVDGVAEAQNAFGTYLVIDRPAEAYFSTGALEDAARIHLGRGLNAPTFVFMDLETTGFSSTPLFLAGTAAIEDGSMRCIQVFARDYSEERAVIGALDEILTRHDFCVTFNGKSFDMPYLRERAKYHKVELVSAPEQFDILHAARRKWRHSLPDCRLVTLERHVLGRRRIGDTPGWEVPCIYHEFVHTKDARRIRGVLRHNLVDVLSMAELFVSLAEADIC